MARLPTPGSDDGEWGDILNDFLNQSHEDDGALKTVPVSQGGTGATSLTDARQSLSVPKRLELQTVSATTYELSNDDSYKYVRCTNASGCVITVPAGLTMSTCTEIHIRSATDGTVSLDPADGVTINAPIGGTYQLAGNGATVTLVKIDTNEYDLIGLVVAT